MTAGILEAFGRAITTASEQLEGVSEWELLTTVGLPGLGSSGIAPADRDGAVRLLGLKNTTLLEAAKEISRLRQRWTLQ